MIYVRVLHMGFMSSANSETVLLLDCVSLLGSQGVSLLGGFILMKADFVRQQRHCRVCRRAANAVSNLPVDLAGF